MDLAVIHHIRSFSARLWESILESPLSFITITLSVVSSAYLFGRYHVSAQKNKELAEKIMEFDIKYNEQEQRHREEIEHLRYQHRQELKDRDKEVSEWKEKYFQLMIERTKIEDRSP